MAASVTITGQALTDPRFGKLAKRTGLADGDHARGKLEHVWSYCTDRQLYFVSAEDFDLIAGVEGLARAACLPEVGLAEETERGIRVRGARGKIEWIKKLRNNAKKGGDQTKANWQAKRGPKPRPDEGQTPGPSSSSSSSSSSSPAKKQRGREELPPAAAAIEPEPVVVVEPRTRATDPKLPTGDHATFIADFEALFAEANGEARPTWGGRQGKIVKSLLAAHGLEECRRRAGIMFRAPPPFPPPPFDIGTLEQHFDKFAKPFKQQGGHFKVTGDEKYAGGEVEI